MKIIGITPGDPAGIGPEIVLKALHKNPQLLKSCFPVIFSQAKILNYYAKLINIPVRVEILKNLDSLPTYQKDTVYCYPCGSIREMPHLGEISASAGKVSFESIRTAIEMAQAGKIAAVVTGPINKQALKLAGIPFMDHTEMFSQLTSSHQTQTLFITGKLRIFFLTRHIALAEVAQALDPNLIIRALHNSQTHLKQIGIKNPRLALAALNPHGGEHGLFGLEEDTILKPAVEKCISLGIDVLGPIPADSVFHLAKSGVFDAVLSLYHDQGHIAAKTLDFYGTVSLTMGLPFLRTSVDHGTAMDIAAQNRANERSMVEAIRAAIRYAW